MFHINTGMTIKQNGGVRCLGTETICDCGFLWVFWVWVCPGQEPEAMASVWAAELLRGRSWGNDWIPVEDSIHREQRGLGSTPGFQAGSDRTTQQVIQAGDDQLPTQQRIRHLS